MPKVRHCQGGLGGVVGGGGAVPLGLMGLNNSLYRPNSAKQEPEVESVLHEW